jgi:hypothetical protein
MGDFTTIRAVSRTLKTILETQITASAEPDLGGVAIFLDSPREIVQAGTTPAVSLWLYHLARNPELANAPERRATFDTVAPAYLPIDLRYLVTPIADDTASEHALMGRVLQVFHDHAKVDGLALTDSLSGKPDALRVSLEPLSLEELTRVWDALKEPYQLSVAYLVQVVRIESARGPRRAPPVIVRDLEIGIATPREQQ